MKPFDDRFAEGLGKKIQGARVAANLSQRALREAVGLCRSQMSRIEKGQSVPTTLVFAKLCKRLDVSADALLQDLVD